MVKIDVMREGGQVVLKAMPEGADPTILRMPPALAAQIAVALLGCSSDEELTAYFAPRASDMRRLIGLFQRIMDAADASEGSTRQ